MEVEIYTEFWLPVYQTTRHHIPDHNENFIYFEIRDVLIVVSNGVAYFLLTRSSC
jgi:hypothetical protein